MNKIMSGKYSKKMWKFINKAKTKSQLRIALYFVCCRLQELESKYDNQLDILTVSKAIDENLKNNV